MLPRDPAALLRTTLVVMAGIGLAISLWQLQHLLLLLFAGVLTAQMFHGLAMVFKNRFRLPFALALAFAVILPMLALLLIFGLFGSLMFDQFSLLAKQLPASLNDLRDWLLSSAEGRQIAEAATNYAPNVGTMVDIARTSLTNFGVGISQFVIILVAGIYLAAQPRLYLDGLVKSLTKVGSADAQATLTAIHTALGAWLKAQAVGMAFVAVGTAFGLWLVGLPSAIAIGFVAGVCEFVPYLGVILVSLPAILIGFSISPETGIFTIIVLVIVQQLQGNLVSPMAQGKLADIPPALTIFSLLAFGSLFGVLGVILAVPLTVVGMVLYRRALSSKAQTKQLPEAGG